MNKFSNSSNNYSQWRRNTKINNTYYLNNSFIEYTFINNEQIPYLIIEVNESYCDLDQHNWHKSMLGTRKNKIDSIKQLAKNARLPWIVVFFKIENNHPKFKVYNDTRIYETIYDEYEYLKILDEFKKETIKKYNNRKK